MSFQYDTDSQEKPQAQEASPFWAQQLATYLAPYHERLGQCDLRASARRRRNPTTPTRLTPPGLGGGGDRRGAVARSGEESKAYAAARRNTPVYLGEPRVGKAGKRETARLGSGALQPRATAGTQPQRRVQSARSHAGECARL